MLKNTFSRQGVKLKIPFFEKKLRFNRLSDKWLQIGVVLITF